MKIQYLQEGYIKSVDKMKDIAGKKYTADDIRKDTKKILLEPVLKMLEDSEFLRKCGNCLKPFVSSTQFSGEYDSSSPSHDN